MLPQLVLFGLAAGLVDLDDILTSALITNLHATKAILHLLGTSL